MTPYPSTSHFSATELRPCLKVSLRMLSITYFQDGGMNACVVLISCQLTQSYAPTAKTRGSFIKMSFSVELKPAPPAFKSKVWKDFGFEVLYDTQGVRNLVKEIVICGHCFLELRYVSCIVSWHLYRDMYRVLRKCIVAALETSRNKKKHEVVRKWNLCVNGGKAARAFWLGTAMVKKLQQKN